MKTETVQAGTFVHEALSDPVYQGFQILRWGFVVAPLIAGIDKFFMKLTDWTMYLWPPLANLVGGAHRFMMIVGAIEIIAGFLVAFKPRIGGIVVAAWLLGIIVKLLLLQGYYDIALRDFGLLLAAFAMSRLAARFQYS